MCLHQLPTQRRGTITATVQYSTQRRVCEVNTLPSQIPTLQINSVTCIHAAYKYSIPSLKIIAHFHSHISVCAAHKYNIQNTATDCPTTQRPCTSYIDTASIYSYIDTAYCQLCHQTVESGVSHSSVRVHKTRPIMTPSNWCSETKLQLR